MKLTAKKAQAIAAIVSAGIAFLLVTQSDVTLAPAVKAALGLVSVLLAAADWSTLLGEDAE